MGRYPGSSTTLRPTPDGTKWDSGNPFDYSDGTERKSRVPLSKAERKEFEEAQARDAGKLLRSFVSQCATAYADHKLSANPIPPKSLRRIINAAAGNVSWLASDQSYRALFVRAYCRLCGEQIPYEKIWNDQGIGAKSSGASPSHHAASADQEKNKTKEGERKRPTAFEKAVQFFLMEYADASVRGHPRPQPPVEVRQRYNGKLLQQWEKSILSSDLFKSAMKKARETKAGR